ALQTLIKTTGNTDLMHESFDVDDDTQFTREWFSWANMMYCELLLTTLGFKIER
ncbi:glycoside hydrolase family 125 protein, partial [Lactiplantibacillus plantarum]